MDEMLRQAAKEGDVASLYALLAQDPHLLLNLERVPFLDSPLHLAASAGHTLFAMEVATLAPALASKLDSVGLSPMHLALRNCRIQTVRALMTVDEDLLRVRGRDRVTPLHLAVEIEETELLAEFLCLCPSVITDLTSRCETAVHIAVKKCRFDAFRVLLGWLIRVNMEEVLNWKDEDGNTVLHIAVGSGQAEVVKLLIKQVNVNSRNFDSHTPLDMYYLDNQHSQNKQIEKLLCSAGGKTSSNIPKSSSSMTLSRYLSRNLSFIERRDKYLGIRTNYSWGSELRNEILVVAILTATATYQASLSPPGGYWQDNYDPPTNSTQGRYLKPHRAGEMVMEGPNLFYFLSFNTVAFFTSICTILILIVGLPCARMLMVSVCFLLMTYYASLRNNFPSEAYKLAGFSLGLAMYVMALLVFMFPVVAFKRHEWLKDHIDSPRRRLGDFIREHRVTRRRYVEETE
ncbi:hypothetical protein MLD38_023498 [Melastoma candidum]|uniref:Uncharacterized protein n=1 Tax=Melastoma candidum TaxID=119954 RepID=A0ACB9NPX7_9MYRT|nr:hypothetical protein MLD38_023498 [Melastoma candidum]